MAFLLVYISILLFVSKFVQSCSVFSNNYL